MPTVWVTGEISRTGKKICKKGQDKETVILCPDPLLMYRVIIIDSGKIRTSLWESPSAQAMLHEKDEENRGGYPESISQAPV